LFNLFRNSCEINKKSNKTLTMLVLYVCKFCALIWYHCTKCLHKMCKTSW